MKRLEDAKLRQDYEAALKTLDSIPPEVIRFYENRTQEPVVRHEVIREKHMDMNFEKNASVKFEDYTEKVLAVGLCSAEWRWLPNQCRQVLTNSPETTKLVYSR